MEQIASILRGVLQQISPQLAAAAKALPDAALVGAAAGAVILLLIILVALIGMIGGGSRKKKRARAEQEAHAPPQRAPAPNPRAPDPVQKIQRDAESGVARVKQDTERLVETLLAERDKALKAERPFAGETPMRGFHLLAEKLMSSDAPAHSAARRRIFSGDIDGARADLKRYVEEANGRDGAWRDLAVLESLRDLDGMLNALEQARAADPKDFVTLVMLRRIYSGIKRTEQALDAGNAAVAVARDDRERAVGLDELGVALIQMNNAAGARKALTESLALVERLAANSPNDLERQRDVAVGNYKIATLGGPDSRDRLVASIAVFERLNAIRPLAPEDATALGQLRTVLAAMDKEAAQKK